MSETAQQTYDAAKAAPQYKVVSQRPGTTDISIAYFTEDQIALAHQRVGYHMGRGE